MSGGRRSYTGTLLLCALCFLGGALLQVALTEAHLEADKRVRAACSALAEEALRLVEMKARMIAPADAVAVGP